MKLKMSGVFLGAACILLGIYLFLGNYFQLYFDEIYLGMVVFGFLTVLCLTRYILDRQKWWGLVLGAVFLFITYVFVIESLFWYAEESISVAFFWIAGSTFLTGFLRNRDRWGLIIPSGVMFTLGLMVLIEIYRFDSSDFSSGFYFFMGLAVTFGVLYFKKNEKHNLSWAAYPAVILLFFALMSGFFDRHSLAGELFVPALFILVGLYILVKNILNWKKEKSNELQVQ